MALVAVLVMVAILSLTLVAFVNTMTLDRTASYSYSQSFKADQLACGGAWRVVQELQDEMAAGAAPDTTGGGQAVYTNVTAANVMPRLVGTNAAMPSLVKVSLAGTSAYVPGGTLSNGGVLPSPVSTATKSGNGHYVSAGRWNQICLGAFPSTAALPYWITVTRSGPSSVTDVTKLRNLQDTANYAIGRYAYAIYDEGGLLDINAAGYPQTFADGSSLSAPDAARKGTPGTIDLTAVPGLSAAAVNSLLLWRAASTALSTGAFLTALYPTNAAATNADAVLSVTNVVGTVTNVTRHPYVAPGDNSFLSRQDLISYAQSHGITNALPYLATFSRDVNGPSFSPASAIPAGFALPAAPGTYPNATNVNALLVRNAATKQPLLAQRFPLSRLALFNDAANHLADIQAYFGLSPDNDGYSWDYRAGATGILPLSQVAALGRDPDFFELLQAAVLQGSLVPYAQPYSNKVNPPVPPSCMTLLRMGADLIDQYDSDDMPTVINFNKEKVAGVENLPYFDELLFWPYRPLGDATRATLKGYFLVQLWNPHQNAATPPSHGPSELRCLLMTSDQAQGLGFQVVASGRSAVTTNAAGAVAILTNSASVTNAVQLSYPGSQSANPPAYVAFTNSAAFAEPRLLDSSTVSASDSSSYWGEVKEGANVRAGFLILSASLPDARVTVPAPAVGATNMVWTNLDAMVTAASANSMGLRLEFKDTKGNWQPYQGGNPGVAAATNLTQTFYGNLASGYGSIQATDKTVGAFPPPGVTAANVAAFTNFAYVAPHAFYFSDPRSIWPGFAEGDSTVNQTIRPNAADAGAKVGSSYASIMATNLYTLPSAVNGAGIYTGTSPYVAFYNENASNNVFAAAHGLAANNTFFGDNDGVLRPGDGYYGGNPFPAGAVTNRPVLLNRPFRSVGEMGFAFRGGGPWKTVDFFSPASADAGLLDYFSVDAAPLVEGRINLNTRQSVSLQAALQGAYKSEAAQTTLSPAESAAIAAAITNATAQAAFVNRADLVRSFSTNAVLTDPVKTQREAAVRALGDLGTTRTWNLLVDVIAQVGHYPPSATDPAQFVVEGERRCWLHVAIDRYTGQIVDSKLEAYEE